MSDVRGVLAVDLGGTNLRVAAISASGEIMVRESGPSDAARGPEPVIARMADLCQRVAGRAGLADDAPIGVASPGPLDPKTGVVLFTPNLTGWRDVPLGASLSRITGRYVRVANDANCAALGEARFGGAIGYEHVIYLGLGTGVGGGVIVNGEMYEGGYGLGAELGHVTVSLDGPRCTCGGIGCLEAYTSGWAIAREAQYVAATEDGEQIVAAAAGREPDARAVTLAAEQGDPTARAILDRAGRALGAAMGAFINIFNPEAIVIGGGLAHSGEALLAPARAAVASYSMHSMRNEVHIVHATLGDDNGLMGAAALALDLARS